MHATLHDAYQASLYRVTTGGDDMSIKQSFDFCRRGLVPSKGRESVVCAVQLIPPSLFGQKLLPASQTTGLAT